MEPQLQERLERIEQPKQVNNENDTLYIKNIDVGCSDEDFDSVRVSERFKDLESGRIVTSFKELNYHFKHAEKYQVRWSGTPFDLKPGEVKKMPRFLGEHFAYHLCNHMLGKISPNSVNDPLKRPAMIERIIVKEEPFFSSVSDTVGEAITKQVEALNVDSPTTDLGDGIVVNNGGRSVELGETVQEAYDPLRRVNKESVEETEAVITRIGQDSPEDNQGVPEDWQSHTRSDIIKLIRDMDPAWKFGQNVSKAQLVGILKKTAGV